MLAELLKNPEQVNQILAALGTIAALWWRVSKAAAKNHLDQENLKTEVIRLSAASVEAVRVITQLATKLDEREKDVIRLEGALEAVRRDQVQIISSLQQAVSSMNAMWRAMDSLHPDAVPKRASDARGVK